MRFRAIIISLGLVLACLFSGYALAAIYFHSALIASPSLETFIAVGNTGIELFALDERYPAIALVVVAEVMRI